MDSATLHDKIDQTAKSGKAKMYFDLLGTESGVQPKRKLTAENAKYAK